MKNKNLWEVYIIQTTDGKLYTGITNDLDRRFNEHKTHQKGARFFHFASAEKIVFREEKNNRSEATKREIEIKKLNKLEKIKLIKSIEIQQIENLFTEESIT